jgi:hypothetical protein
VIRECSNRATASGKMKLPADRKTLVCEPDSAAPGGRQDALRTSVCALAGAAMANGSPLRRHTGLLRLQHLRYPVEQQVDIHRLVQHRVGP